MDKLYSSIHTKNLVISLIREQISIADQQQNLVKKRTCPGVEESRMYINTMAGLSVCNELSLKNTQLKELYFYKIKMMRHELNGLSRKLEQFKDCLKTYAEKRNKYKSE